MRVDVMISVQLDPHASVGLWHCRGIGTAPHLMVGICLQSSVIAFGAAIRGANLPLRAVNHAVKATPEGPDKPVGAA